MIATGLTTTANCATRDGETCAVPKMTYIDLDEAECTYLKRLMYAARHHDHAFSILCKLSDSMKVNGMAEDRIKEHHKAMANWNNPGYDHEADHPATKGVEAYAEDGRAYYKTAAKAQWAIGLGALAGGVAQIVTAVAVVLILLTMQGCAGIRHAQTIKAVVEQTNQPVKSVSGSFKSKQFRVEFFDQPNK